MLRTTSESSAITDDMACTRAVSDLKGDRWGGASKSIEDKFPNRIQEKEKMITIYIRDEVRFRL